jgi:serine/threonine-protein kinase
LEKNAPIRSLPYQYGKYELLQRLGSGGMAEIFLARQAGAAGFEKLTVIKRILPQLGHDERMEAAFIAEARLMAEIRHHNVVHVYELDRLPNGEFFMAMEYVDGTDLRLLLKTAKRAGLRLPPWLSVKITCDILDALRVVHSLADDRGRPRNVVHRDVTPSNIFVSKQGDVKLGDFGVAKDDQRGTLTRHGELKGKISYMAPEQLSRGEVDRRADLFSMGVVLCECLAQRRRFGGGEVPEMLVKNRI